MGEVKTVTQLLDDFMLRAALAGTGVALAAAPLGCFAVWRRMAYFGDATAHAAVLGVAFALALNLSVFVGALTIALMMALVVTHLTRAGLASDTVLGVTSHSSLALGLVAVSLMTGVRFDLMSYLFGDVLAVSRTDLVVIWAGGATVVALLIWRWNALLAATLSPELAQSSGVDPKREELVVTLTLAIVVAIAIKVVGVLLIAALLLIPAATARPFSRTPEVMAGLAAGIGVASALGGLHVSYHADTPTGPTIVSVAAVLFLASRVLSALRAPS